MVQFVVSFSSQFFFKIVEGYPHDGDYSQSQWWNQNSPRDVGYPSHG